MKFLLQAQKLLSEDLFNRPKALIVMTVAGNPHGKGSGSMGSFHRASNPGFAT
jgi:hypothetical protein